MVKHHCKAFEYRSPIKYMRKIFGKIGIGIGTPRCAYQGVRNGSFLEKLCKPVHCMDDRLLD